MRQGGTTVVCSTLNLVIQGACDAKPAAFHNTIPHIFTPPTLSPHTHHSAAALRMRSCSSASGSGQPPGACAAATAAPPCVAPCARGLAGGRVAAAVCWQMRSARERSRKRAAAEAGCGDRLDGVASEWCSRRRSSCSSAPCCRGVEGRRGGGAGGVRVRGGKATGLSKAQTFQVHCNDTMTFYRHATAAHSATSALCQITPPCSCPLRNFICMSFICTCRSNPTCAWCFVNPTLTLPACHGLQTLRSPVRRACLTASPTAR